MPSYTYFIFDAASNVAPNFQSFAGARNDFAANNRMGAGIGVIGDGLLTFAVDGHSTLAGNFNFVGAAGLSIVAGGAWLITGRNSLWNASPTNPLAFGAGDRITFSGDEGIITDLCGGGGGRIADLGMSFAMTGATGIQVTQNAAGQSLLVERCALQQRLTSTACGVVAGQANTTYRNCLIQQLSTNVNAYGVDLNLRHGVNPTVEHCTVIGAGSGVGFKDQSGSGSTLTNVRNNMTGRWTTPYGGMTAGSAAGNASSGTDAPGSGAINGVAVSTVNFESVSGSGDWRVKATSVLATTGAARLATTLTDAYGLARSNPTAIGADEAAASDTTPPTLTSPSGTGGLGVCTGSVSTNEAAGDLYAVATASATQPTPLQVRNGQDHTGAAALRVRSQAVTSTGAQSIPSDAISGGAGTRYWHFMHEDAAGNRSAVVSSSGFSVTASATQLVVTVPDAAGLSGFNAVVLSAAAPGAGVTVIATPTGITFNGSGQATISIAGLSVPVTAYRWVSVTNATGDPLQSPAPVQAQGPVQAS